MLKGLGSNIVPGTEFYWLLTYEHGFMRRALIGTLMRPLLAFASFDHLRPAIVTAHVVMCLGIVAMCHGLFRAMVMRETRIDARVTMVAAFVMLMCGPLLPTLAHDVGFIDVYVLTVALAGFWLVLRQRYLGAAIVATGGPLIHEAFAFIWLPVAIMLVWSSVRTKQDIERKLLAAALPLSSMAAVVWLQSAAVAAAAIDALPVSTFVKDGLREFQIGQTVQSSLGTTRYQFLGNWDHVATSAAYLLLPAVATVWAAAYCHWPRWDARWRTLLVAVIVTISPLGVVAFAWDLSRFLVWSDLAAAMMLVGLGSPALVGERP